MSGRHRIETPDDGGRRSRRALAAAVIVTAVVIVLGVGGYVVFGRDGDDDTPTTPTATAELSHAESLQRSFNALKLTTPTGVALTPVGGGETILLGDQHVQDAWSTIKVPLGLAAERKHGMSRTEANALIDSDNLSARVLTRSLGSPVGASEELTAVLREGGDTTTVPAPRHGDDYPMLGETPWSLADSATWTAHLPCMIGSDHVLELMRDVAGVQEWGLRLVGDHTPVKGGWGEAPDGGYVVRQIGVLTVANGKQVAVSMSTHRAKMAFETGTRELDRVADWLNANLALLPGGTCR
ncbi:serine hydrolase [Gordonia sp. MP11Mi]|uniref:Serine hydrolase n=1 Tax=Gordonia sp. MP11Mi TaxID=3022769 RepID=A0AA97CZ00_9ACTN